jgi:hypothetical protein
MLSFLTLCESFGSWKVSRIQLVAAGYTAVPAFADIDVVLLASACE